MLFPRSDQGLQDRVLPRGDGRDSDDGKRRVGRAVVAGELRHRAARARVLVLGDRLARNDIALDHDLGVGNRTLEQLLIDTSSEAGQ